MRTVFYTPGTPVGGRRVVAVGLFDGVHLAHRELLGVARKIADREQLPLAVLTFSEGEFRPKAEAPRLLSLDARLSLLAACGVEEVFVADFADLAPMSPAAFAEEVLLRDLGCAYAAVGFNFTFGAGAKGDAELLRGLLAACGIGTFIAPRTLFLGKTLSSTLVRGLLTEDGNARLAAEALGYPYFFEGPVEHGDGRGKTIGFPTVNISLPDTGIVPRSGVYVSVLEAHGERFPALTDVGTCPTFGARALHTETFALEEVGDLWGERARVYLLDYLRPERTFPGVAGLEEQIAKDIEKAKKLYGEEKWQAIGRN